MGEVNFSKIQVITSYSLKKISVEKSHKTILKVLLMKFTQVIKLV